MHNLIKHVKEGCWLICLQVTLHQTCQGGLLVDLFTSDTSSVDTGVKA